MLSRTLVHKNNWNLFGHVFSHVRSSSNGKTAKVLPKTAEVVIIGGGVLGCSTAWQLGERGVKDVIILERHKVTSGTTWHAAGLVSAIRGNSAHAEMCKHSTLLYPTFVDESGQSTVGWHNTGSVSVARNEQRLEVLKRTSHLARELDIEYRLLPPEKLKEIHPFWDVSTLIGASHTPGDGIVNPTDLCFEYERRAKANGTRVYEDCAVESMILNSTRDKVLAVKTADGQTVSCNQVLVACGMWTRQVAALADTWVPIGTVPHQYAIFENLEGVNNSLPVTRDFDYRIYIKPEVGGLLIGEFEDNPPPKYEDGVIPTDIPFHVYETDMDKSVNGLEGAMQDIPDLNNVGIKRFLHGPDSHSADDNIIMGPSPNVTNLFVGAGMNSSGIATSGGFGVAMSEWMTEGYPQSFKSDFFGLDLRRFVPWMAKNPEMCSRLARESYQRMYPIHFPYQEFINGRDLKHSAFHDVLKEKRAKFGQAYGWERPMWFAPESQPDMEETLSMFKKDWNWMDQAHDEVLACRNQAVLLDMSSFGKFMVESKSGDHAARLLGYLCSNDVEGPETKNGKVTYTQMLNKQAGIEGDITVAQLSPNKFYVTVGASAVSHHRQHMQKYAPMFSSDISIKDLSEDWSVLAIMGPWSRFVLSRAAPQFDFQNTAFPFGSASEITIGSQKVLALRVSYVGELGWELHIPNHSAVKVHNELQKAAELFGGLPYGGYRAIESMRLEKKFVHWSHDVTPLDNPVQAGLSWALKLKTSKDFLGREMCEKIRQTGPDRRLVSISADPSVTLLGHECIYRNGKRVGYLTSAGHSFFLNRSIGLGYVDGDQGGAANLEYIKSGQYNLDVAGTRVPVEATTSCLYDPKGTRLHQEDPKDIEAQIRAAIS